MGPIWKQNTQFVLLTWGYFLNQRQEKKPILRLGRETQDLDFLCPERPQFLGWSSRISPANDFCDRKRLFGRQICKRIALIKLKSSDLHDVNLNSAQATARLGFSAAQKNLSLGLSLPRDVSNLGSATQVLASLCHDLASGKSLNQAWWALGVRYEYCRGGGGGERGGRGAIFGTTPDMCKLKKVTKYICKV